MTLLRSNIKFMLLLSICFALAPLRPFSGAMAAGGGHRKVDIEEQHTSASSSRVTETTSFSSAEKKLTRSRPIDRNQRYGSESCSGSRSRSESGSRRSRSVSRSKSDSRSGSRSKSRSSESGSRGSHSRSVSRSKSGSRSSESGSRGSSHSRNDYSGTGRRADRKKGGHRRHVEAAATVENKPLYMRTVQFDMLQESLHNAMKDDKPRDWINTEAKSAKTEAIKTLLGALGQHLTQHKRHRHHRRLSSLQRGGVANMQKCAIALFGEQLLTHAFQLDAGSSNMRVQPRGDERELAQQMAEHFVKRLKQRGKEHCAKHKAVEGAKKLLEQDDQLTRLIDSVVIDWNVFARLLSIVRENKFVAKLKEIDETLRETIEELKFEVAADKEDENKKEEYTVLLLRLQVNARKSGEDEEYQNLIRKMEQIEDTIQKLRQRIDANTEKMRKIETLREHFNKGQHIDFNREIGAIKSALKELASWPPTTKKAPLV